MWLELSYEYSETMPVYPGSPEEKFTRNNQMSRGDHCNTSIITHYLHGGTHVDAPFHFYNKGKTIAQIPIEDFIYQHPLLIQKALKKSEFIEPEDLKAYGDALYTADILLFYTEYCKLRNDAARYADDFPALSEAAAKFIRTEVLNVKAVAIDVLSIESAILGPKENYKVHKTLLDGDLYSVRPLLIYEDVNIGKVLGQTMKRIYAFPLRLKGLEASPVNIVAEVIA